MEIEEEEEAPLEEVKEAEEAVLEGLEGNIDKYKTMFRLGGGFKRDRDEYRGRGGRFGGRGGRRRAFSDEGRERRGGRGGRGRRFGGGRRFRDGGKKGKEHLDKEMNEYWEKAGDKEHGK